MVLARLWCVVMMPSKNQLKYAVKETVNPKRMRMSCCRMPPQITAAARILIRLKRQRAEDLAAEPEPSAALKYLIAGFRRRSIATLLHLNTKLSIPNSMQHTMCRPVRKLLRSKVEKAATKPQLLIRLHAQYKANPAQLLKYLK